MCRMGEGESSIIISSSITHFIDGFCHVGCHFGHSPSLTQGCQWVGLTRGLGWVGLGR